VSCPHPTVQVGDPSVWEARGAQLGHEGGAGWGGMGGGGGGGVGGGGVLGAQAVGVLGRHGAMPYQPRVHKGMRRDRDPPR